MGALPATPVARRRCGSPSPKYRSPNSSRGTAADRPRPWACRAGAAGCRARRSCLVPGRQDAGVDLAWRHRVHPHAGATQIGRQFAGQRPECRLRRGVRRRRERMHPRAHDGGHVHHCPSRRLQRCPQPLHQCHTGKEVHVEDVQPVGVRHLQCLNLPAVRPFRRDRRVVDQRIQAVAHDVAQSRHRGLHAGDVGKIELDVVLRPTLPWAARIERMARDGQYPPPRVAERLHRGVPDAAARPGQQKNALSLGHAATIAAVPVPRQSAAAIAKHADIFI